MSLAVDWLGIGCPERELVGQAGVCDSEASARPGASPAPSSLLSPGPSSRRPPTPRGLRKERTSEASWYVTGTRARGKYLRVAATTSAELQDALDVELFPSNLKMPYEIVPDVSHSPVLPRLRPAVYPTHMMSRTMPVLLRLPLAPPRLPLEIIWLILESMDESLWCLPHQRWVDGRELGERHRLRTLARCCLVSRTFGAAARAVLYRTIFINEYDQEVEYLPGIDATQLALRLNNSPSLGKLVRELSVWLHLSPLWTLSSIIGQSHFIQSLYLDLSQHSNDLGLIWDLLTASDLELTELRLNVPRSSKPHESKLLDLLTTQSGLSVLALTLQRRSFVLVAPKTTPGATPPTFHLLELILDEHVPEQLLAFLTTNSHDSLSSLFLNCNKRDQPHGPSDAFDSEDLAPFTSLTSLSLWGYISTSSLNSLHTPSLRALSLYNVYETGAALHDLSNILLRLPPTIQSLTFNGVDQLSPPKLTAWIESDACPSLSHVSWGKTSLEADAFEALQRACKTRALSLREVKSGVVAADEYGDDDLYAYECPPFEDDDWSGDLEEGKDEAGDRPEVEPTKSGSLLRYL